MGVRLPAEYQEVKWIGTTGTQIIDTDYLPVDGDEMSIEFSFTSFPGSKNYYCLAATNNSDPQVQFIFGNDSGSRTLFYKYFSTGSAKMLKTSFAVNTIYRIDVASNGDCTCNGVTVSPVNNLGYATGHMRFFARMAGNINFIGRLYTFVASHSGTEKVNLVPCYRKADDKPGMYDLVSGEFFTNAGTGEFTVGPDVIDSISPWLVARRRLLMRKPSLDTSPRIAQYGVTNPSGNPATKPYIENANYCVTVIYAYTPPASRQSLELYGGTGNVILYADGTYKDYWVLTGESQPHRRNVINADTNGISCSLKISMLADSYAFRVETGEILFAGRNSIYYGHRNINELN